MTQFPPVPTWIPSFDQPTDRISERLNFYSNHTKDFVVFEHGTCVIVDRDMPDEQAVAIATDTLAKIFNFHPDMNPLPMKDGNILVQYNHPAINIVLSDICLANWPEIETRHLDGLTPHEVLITPLGQNIFDDFGKMALLGRAYFFLDAQKPKFVSVERITR